jgi:hypothetical protein
VQARPAAGSPASSPPPSSSTRGGIWPNRDATAPRTIAEERGYDEIVALMTAQEAKRGASGADALGDGLRRLLDAMMTGGEEAVIGLLESEPTIAGLCPPDGLTMLHRIVARIRARSNFSASSRQRRALLSNIAFTRGLDCFSESFSAWTQAIRAAWAASWSSSSVRLSGVMARNLAA